MKVIEVLKHYRNGTIVHHMVLSSNASEDMIKELAEDWAEKDLAGSNYGYTLEWSLVEDKMRIVDIIEREIALTNLKISRLEQQKSSMKKFLKL